MRSNTKLSPVSYRSVCLSHMEGFSVSGGGVGLVYYDYFDDGINEAKDMREY